jgi:O-antigen/teichoic acid export membrane protein
MPETPFVTQPLDPNDAHRLADGTPLEREATAAAVAESEAVAERHRLMVRGLQWGVLFQAVEVVISFGAMLILVRVIPPGDYGRAAAVVGVLGILAIFNTHLFIGHALQLPEGETPDWSLHWAMAFYLQLALFLICHAIAGICWLFPAYLPMAKLLHVAAFGVMFDAAGQLGATMLRRELQFKRLKTIGTVGVFCSVVAIVGLALSGARAYAIVVGRNVVPSLPFAIDLIFVRRWRPKPGWWRLREWREYSAAAKFGSQRVAGGIVGGLHDAADAALLPALIGFSGIGLVNRAQALFGSTVGRVGSVLADTVYPFLPRETSHPERFAFYATLYLQLTLLLALPGALFVGQQGQLLSRVLYGGKWIAADPLMFPGAVIGFAGALNTAAAGVLLAGGYVRTCLLLEAVGFVAAVPAWWVAWSTPGLSTYTWVLAGSQLAVAVGALLLSGHLLEPKWFRTTALPPFVAGGVGAAIVALMTPMVIAWRPALQIGAEAAAFWATVLAVLRVCFVEVLETLLAHVPGGERCRAWLGLQASEHDGLVRPLVPETGK